MPPWGCRESTALTRRHVLRRAERTPLKPQLHTNWVLEGTGWILRQRNISVGHGPCREKRVGACGHGAFGDPRPCPGAGPRATAAHGHGCVPEASHTRSHPRSGNPVTSRASPMFPQSSPSLSVSLLSPHSHTPPQNPPAPASSPQFHLKSRPAGTQLLLTMSPGTSGSSVT